jgi:hypothetical protein
LVYFDACGDHFRNVLETESSTDFKFQTFMYVVNLKELIQKLNFRCCLVYTLKSIYEPASDDKRFYYIFVNKSLHIIILFSDSTVRLWDASGDLYNEVHILRHHQLTVNQVFSIETLFLDN